MRFRSKAVSAVSVLFIGACSMPVQAAEDDAKVPVPRVIGTRPKAVAAPDARPFVGPKGEDTFGYPLRTADRIALGQLLRLRKFDALDRYLAEYQADFERDPKKEYWPIDAFDTFDSQDPEVGEAIDEWVE